MIEDVDPASLKTPGAVGAGASSQFQFSRMGSSPHEQPRDSQEERVHPDGLAPEPKQSLARVLL